MFNRIEYLARNHVLFTPQYGAEIMTLLYFVSSVALLGYLSHKSECASVCLQFCSDVYVSHRMVFTQVRGLARFSFRTGLRTGK